MPGVQGREHGAHACMHYGARGIEPCCQQAAAFFWRCGHVPACCEDMSCAWQAAEQWPKGERRQRAPKKGVKAACSAVVAFWSPLAEVPPPTPYSM